MTLVDATHEGRCVRTVLQVGDLHLRSSELADQEPVLRWIGDVCDDRDVDLVVLAGDLSGRAAPHLARPAERNALVSFLARMAEEARHVVVLRGNHDVPDDWKWIQDAWPYGETSLRAWVTAPTTFAFRQDPEDADGPRLLLHCLPYPDRSWVAASARLDREELTGLVEGSLAAICAGWFTEKRPGDRSILSAHAATRGAVTSTGQPLIGTDVEVPVTTLRQSGADLVLLSHIHKPQDASTDGRVLHVGSPWPTDYGEQEDKRIVLAEVAAHDVLPESLPTPCVRRVSVDLEWTGDSWRAPDGWETTDDARVRLRLHYDEGQAVDLAAAEALVPGAVATKLERVPRRIRRERAPEVIAATTPVDRYCAFERSEGRQPDERELTLASCLVDGQALDWLEEEAAAPVATADTVNHGGEQNAFDFS